MYVPTVTTGFVWDESNLAAETYSNGNIKFMYQYGADGIVAREDYENLVTLYLKNAHGDVVGLTLEDGSIDSRYIYDAFGNQLASSPDINPFRYCGEYYDAETGLIYLRNRYYDSENGRFINEDPIQDGLNWYVYCDNNPVSFVDPSGLDYVPLRETVEAAGGSIEWNDSTKTAVVEVQGKTFKFSSSMMYDVDGRGKTYIDDVDDTMYIWIDDTSVMASRIDVPPDSSGYVPPKGGPRWDNEKKGWKDKYGNVWVRDKTNHGGKHWDVQYPNGGYDNVYEDGYVRKGSGGRGRFSPAEVTVDSKTLDGVAIAIGLYVFYQGIKWTIVTITAVPSGGASVGLAAVLP